MSFTLVVDVGSVAVLVGDVGDDLVAAVGQKCLVFSLGLVAVSLFSVAVVVAVVVVFHCPVEFVVGLKTMKYTK